MTSLPMLCALLTLQQTTPLTVGPVTARPGERASGYLDVPAGVDSGTRIPITVIRGARPGPTVALIAGTHGVEVAPIVALQRARAAIDPAELAGTVLMVHVANLPSYLRRTVYYSPIDGKNLNRVYPGRAGGTVSERIAHTITTEIIARADYLVDMHSGDGNEMVRPYAYAARLGLDARTDSLSREIALAWGHTRIVIDTERPRDPAASVYTQNTAHLRRTPAITSEGGYLGLADEEMVQHNLTGVLRLLRHLGMLPGAPAPLPAAVYFERTEVVRSPGTGIWYPAVAEGQAVAAGSVLGVLTGFFGDTLAVLRAPFGGVMMYVVPTPAMNQGEPVGMVAVPILAP
jgi:predicted deacylase